MPKQKVKGPMVTVSYKFDSTYFVTLTQKPSLKQSDYKIQYLSTNKSVFNSYSHSCNFLFIPELTTAGDIHYHGLVNIIDKVKWYKKTLRLDKDDFGFKKIIKVSSLQSFDRIMKYIMKELAPVTSEVLEIPTDELYINDTYYYTEPQKDVNIVDLHISYPIPIHHKQTEEEKLCDYPKFDYKSTETYISTKKIEYEFSKQYKNHLHPCYYEDDS